jgi:alpha-glucosidase
VHGIVQEMRALVDQYSERLLIGEIYLPIRQLVAYYGAADNGVHLPFNFQLITLPWEARQIAAAISEYEGSLPPNAWPNWVLGNHDQPRLASRVGLAQARVAAMLLLTLRGTPTIYYGDEIGMRDGVIAPEAFQDPQGKNVGISRDPQRTPMQWSSVPGAGFTTGTPWLPLAITSERHTVEQQRQDRTSMLSLYRQLIALRRREPALSVGTYTPVVTEGDVLAYIREAHGKHFLIVLNLGHHPGQLALEATGPGRIVVATDPDRVQHRVANRLLLAGDEGVVMALDASG